MSKDFAYPEELRKHKPATRRALKSALVRRERRTAGLELRRVVADLATAEVEHGGDTEGQVGPRCRLCGHYAEDCFC